MEGGMRLHRRESLGVDQGKAEGSKHGWDRDVAVVPHFGWWLALVTASGLLMRLIIVYRTQHNWVGGDGYAYSVQANMNANGRWFVDSYRGTPDALHPPAWAVVLTAWAWLGGHSWLQQQVLSCGIGSTTVAMIGLAGRRIAGERAGLVAAGIAAVYAGLWAYERELMSETLLLLGIAVMILMAYRFRDRASAGRAAGLGVLSGLLALTRSEQILVLPLLVAPLIVTVKGVGWRRRTGWLALACLSMLVVLAPWMIFNLGRFQRPVLLSNNFGYAMIQGSCDSSFYGSTPGSDNAYSKHFRGLTGPGHIGYFDLRCAGLVAGGDQSVADAIYRRNALAYTERHLSRLPIVLVAREGRAFGYWDPFQQVVLDANWEGPPPSLVSVSYVPAAIWVGRLGLISYWLLLMPAVAGAVVLRRRRIPIYVLLAFVATAAIAVAMTFGEIRYRAAAEVPIVLLAAVAIDAVLPSRASTLPSVTDAGTLPADTGPRRANSTAESKRVIRTPSRSVRAVVIAGVTIFLTGLIGIAAGTRTPTPPGLNSGPVTMFADSSNGRTLKGSSVLDDLASHGSVGVEIRASGGTLHNVLIATAKRSPFGWLALWNTTKVPNGAYVLRAIEHEAGQRSHVVEIRVKVAN
jgi:4-amino-4-deoxy-L-arabinose transferase-like glycosyltransferase